MRNIFVIPLLCSILTISVPLSCPASDNTDTGEETSSLSVQLEDFSALTVNVPSEIIYESGAAGCDVNAPSNVIKHIEIIQNGKCLTVRMEKNLPRHLNIRNVVIRLSSETLESVKINGSADFTCKDGFCSESLDINVNGVGDVTVDKLEADRVNVLVNGVGEVDLKELCAEKVEVKINGAGDVVLSGSADDVSVQINGAGDADISALEYRNRSTATNGIGKVKM